MKTDRNLLPIPDFMIVLKALQLIKDIPMSKLYKRTGITYCHLHELKKLFVDKEWIVLTKDKKRHLINLTEKGNKISLGVQYLLQSMNIKDDDINKFRKKTKIKHKDEVDKMEVVEEKKESKERLGETKEGVLISDSNVPEKVEEVKEVVEGEVKEEVVEGEVKEEVVEEEQLFQEGGSSYE